MGTGSKPRQMSKPRENTDGSVPVPFFHAVSRPKKGTGTVGNGNSQRHTGH